MDALRTNFPMTILSPDTISNPQKVLSSIQNLVNHNQGLRLYPSLVKAQGVTAELSHERDLLDLSAADMYCTSLFLSFQTPF